MLPPLLNVIQASTPGTKYKLESEPSDQFGVHIFERIAWAYGPCIAAWPHLRLMIRIDAEHLSGRYKGKLYMACAYDAEQQVLPLAFAIMGEETLDNWSWFMSWLRSEVVGEGRICVISDAHAAIRSVFEQRELGWCEERGEAVHRLCAQHIAQNMFKICKDDGLKGVFKECVRKMKPWRWAYGMKRIEDEDPQLCDYIMKQGKKFPGSVEEPLKLHKWTQCHDGGLNRWGIMTTNGSESLNSVFRVARQLPVTAIVEATWYKCVEWFEKRRGMAANWQAQGLQFSQEVTNKLQHRGSKARSHDVIPLSWNLNNYEVIVRDGVVRRRVRDVMKYEVIFPEGGMPTCTCQKPQFTGIPCNHVLAVCSKRRLDETQYVSEFYSLQQFVDTWNGEWHSFGSEPDWPMYHGPTIRPHPDNINRGRRKHKRIPMVMNVMEGQSRSRVVRRASKQSRAARNSGSTPTTRYFP